MDAQEEASQAAAINNLVPESTTAQLAGAVPLEPKKEEKEDKPEEKPSDFLVLSSAAPESTTAQLAAAVPLEDKKEDALPGGYPETPANELSSKEVSVNPLPAAEGAVNPIKLAPGEEIPKDISAAGVDSHVTLDKESYEKSDRIPGLETTLPYVTGNMIPESSLPITGANDAHISSAAPESTSATLAGQVPLEPKVPEVVKESQEKANAEPEASAISAEVKEKAAVEDELLQKVPEAPSTSEGTAGVGTEKSETDKTAAEQVLAAATSAGEVALGVAITAGSAAAIAATKASGAAADAANKAAPVASDYTHKASDAATDIAHKASDAATNLAAKASAAASGATSHLPDAVKGVLGGKTQEEVAKEQQAVAVDSVSSEVPAEVKESIKEAGVSPEAAVNTAAVVKKEEFEAELVNKVKTDDVRVSLSPEVPTEVKDSIKEAGASPEAAANTTAVENKEQVEAELLEKTKSGLLNQSVSSEVPPEVKQSIEAAGAKPEAAANTAAVENKEAVEAELLEKAKSGALNQSVSSEVPAEVKQSIEAAGARPEAAANTDAVENKDKVETELLEKVQATEAVGESSTAALAKPIEEPAPAEAPQAEAKPQVEEGKAQAVEPPQSVVAVKTVDEAKPAETAPAAESAKAAEEPKPAVAQPVATEPSAPAETAKKDEAHPASNGATTAAAAAPAAASSSTTADKAAADGSGTSDKKKKHRISGFFNKLKHKFQ
jgi:hypothetical protein